MYQFDSRVRYSETDEQGQLSLTGILNYFQDCSTFQSEDLGMGVGYLKEHGRAWWLTSWQIVIDRYPSLGEEITVSTWPYDFKGIYGYRNFAITGSDGRYAARANSLWFFYDIENQKPARQYDQKEPVQVARHHLDTNHHVNNARYVEMAREFLPQEICVKELRVEYKKAAVLGDYITPRVSRIPEGYVTALCDPQGRPHAVVWLRE